MFNRNIIVYFVLKIYKINFHGFMDRQDKYDSLSGAVIFTMTKKLQNKNGTTQILACCVKNILHTDLVEGTIVGLISLKNEIGLKIELLHLQKIEANCLNFSVCFLVNIYFRIDGKRISDLLDSEYSFSHQNNHQSLYSHH